MEEFHPIFLILSPHVQFPHHQHQPHVPSQLASRFSSNDSNPSLAELDIDRPFGFGVGGGVGYYQDGAATPKSPCLMRPRSRSLSSPSHSPIASGYGAGGSGANLELVRRGIPPLINVIHITNFTMSPILLCFGPKAVRLKQKQV